MLATLPDPHAQIEKPASQYGGSPSQIIAQVARAHSLTAGDLTGRSMQDHIVAARVAAMRAVWMAHPHLPFVGVVRLFEREDYEPLRRSLCAAPMAFPGPGISETDGMSSEVVQVISRTAHAFRTSFGAIVGHAQTKTVRNARFAAIHAVREARPAFSVSRIARIFRRHPSTVRDALDRMEREGVPQPPASLTAGDAR